MNPFELAERAIAREVDRLFRENPPRRGEQCVNPVTEGGYIGGEDPIGPQKKQARGALLARDWFALTGPSDAQPLPVSFYEIEDRKHTSRALASLDYIVSCFADSLGANDYDIANHPSFEDFARGVTASKNAPNFVRESEALRRRYPPRPLPGLNAGHCWERPKMKPRTTATDQRNQHGAAV